MPLGGTFGIGMITIEIDLANDLLKEIHKLAERHYGNCGAPEVSRVFEDALRIRLTLLDWLGDHGQEVNEPITNWQFGEVNQQMGAVVQDWLFRKGG